MFKAKVMLNAFEVFASELIEPVKKSINYGKYDLGFFKFDENEWQKMVEMIKSPGGPVYSTSWNPQQKLPDDATITWFQIDEKTHRTGAAVAGVRQGLLAG